jgi:hypothetical protein
LTGGFRGDPMPAGQARLSAVGDDHGRPCGFDEHHSSSAQGRCISDYSIWLGSLAERLHQDDARQWLDRHTGHDGADLDAYRAIASAEHPRWRLQPERWSHRSKLVSRPQPVHAGHVVGRLRLEHVNPGLEVIEHDAKPRT